jgi:serine/threonine protein kinase
MVKKVGAYNLERIIGKGQFGTVYFGSERSTGKPIAGKCVDKAVLSSKLLRQMELEIKTMKQVQSDYVVKLYDVLMTTNNVYLIMEFCAGGDLDHFIKKHGPVPEHIARKWISQMLCAFMTLQANKILHRDLKLANLLLTQEDPELADIKLADFGFARILNENSMAQTQLGTPLFMAPEIFNREDYSYKVDVWSLGALSYEIMTGSGAFNCASIQELRSLQLSPVTFPPDCGLSEEAKDIVLRMLTYEASRRPTFAELQSHPFLRPVVKEVQPLEQVHLSDGPAIHEATEEEINMDEFVIFNEEQKESQGLEVSELSKMVLDITMKIDEAQTYFRSAKKYEDKHELMLAYAYYSKCEQVKAAQKQRLEELIRGLDISLHNDPILSEMFSDLQLDLADLRVKIRDLQLQLAQTASLVQSYVFFSSEKPFIFDENELLKEAERVLGKLEGGQIKDLQEGYRHAEELLKIAVETNPNNVRASAMFSEVKARHRQVSV